MESRFLYRDRNINRGFRKLDIWKLAINFYQNICPVMSNCDVPFKIRGQIQDSALSVSSNIAEGYARRSIKETLRFYESP
ncbi:MAG: four helix bundle protein [candidate division KSB1 bacterium]|nr:four helix bundle protein [candidate division KSB1 bacterium]